MAALLSSPIHTASTRDIILAKITAPTSSLRVSLRALSLLKAPRQGQFSIRCHRLGPFRCRSLQSQENKQLKPENSPPSQSGSQLSESSDGHIAPPHDGDDPISVSKSGAPELGVEAQTTSDGVPAVEGSAIAITLLLVCLAGLGALGYFYRDDINSNLMMFSEWIEGYGYFGYVLFILGYAGLELFAIPAIPLTMSAGLVFGTAVGTVLVSIAATIAATGGFLIARYVARDRIMELAKGNKKFAAIDKAIGNDSFRVVTLLRLSPLLPFAVGNYIYGLTSVKLTPYILGSWLGMLPGTWAYVSAGSLGRTLLQEESAGLGSSHYWTLALGIVATVGAATYVTRLASDALKDVQEEPELKVGEKEKDK